MNLQMDHVLGLGKPLRFGDPGRSTAVLTVAELLLGQSLPWKWGPLSVKHADVPSI